MVILIALIIISSALNGQSVPSITLFSDGNIEEDLQNFPDLIKIADSIRMSIFTPMINPKVYKHKGSYYLMFPEYNNVYKYSQQTLTQLYKGDVHGNNFGRVVFFKNDTLFSYGGAGFWIYFPDITFFSPETGLWEKYEVPGKKPYYDGGRTVLSFYHKNKINLYFFEKIPYSPNSEIHFLGNNRSYVYDFETSKWNTHQLWDHLPKFNVNFLIETESFIVLYHSELVEWIIDKRDLKVYWFTRFLNKFGYVRFPLSQTENKIISGDVVYFLTDDFKINRKTDFGADFSSIDTKQYLFKRKPFILRYWWLVLGFIFVGYCILVFRKLKQLLRFPVKPLLLKTGKSLSQEEFDDILSVDVIQNEDEIRKTRAEKIEYINTYFEKLLTIERKKASFDKRIFLYDIKLKGIPWINKSALFLMNKLNLNP